MTNLNICPITTMPQTGALDPSANEPPLAEGSEASDILLIIPNDANSPEASDHFTNHFGLREQSGTQ